MSRSHLTVPARITLGGLYILPEAGTPAALTGRTGVVDWTVLLLPLPVGVIGLALGHGNGVGRALIAGAEMMFVFLAGFAVKLVVNRRLDRITARERRIKGLARSAGPSAL
jgi:hypothetical protein